MLGVRKRVTYGVFSYYFRILLAAGDAGIAVAVLGLSATGVPWHAVSVAGIYFSANDHVGL